MADSIIYGMTVGIRDVPVKGMQVRLDAGAPYGGLMLEPREAAQLGAELIRQADEAIHASRASRRAPSTCGYPSATHTGDECTKPEGHTGRHRYAGCPHSSGCFL